MPSPRWASALRKKSWSLPETFLPELARREGFVRLQDPVAVTFLVDRALDPPIRMAAYAAVDVDGDYIDRSVKFAWQARQALAREGRLEVHADAAFRIVNGSGDGLPGIAVDYLAGYAFVHVYSAYWSARLPSLHQSLLAIEGIRGVYQTDRTRKEKKSRVREGHVAGERAAEDHILVIENGLQYDIALAAGPAFGLYLDQRENRKKVAELAAGGTLLNTFSYTCSFSLAAARGGAATVSVDLGKPALETAKENFVRNGVALEAHRFIPEDVFVYLPRLARKQETFQVVLLDPPTFARGTKGVFSTEKNYADLVAQAAPLVAPGGHLVAFANTHRMTDARWVEDVRRGLGERSGEYQEVARWKQAPDFVAHPNDPAENYLKSVVFQRRK